ncbi:MAG: DUF4388 domain-containing protein [Acidobacteriota bacterium]
MKSVLEFPVSFVFKKIFLEKLTGELFLKCPKYEKHIFFRNGDLIFAESNLFDEKIGVILNLTGKIVDSQYDYVSGLIHSADKQVGEILVQTGQISKKDLKEATRYQVKRIAISAFSITEGTWDFKKDVLPPSKSVKIKIPLIKIIYDGGKRRGTADSIRSKYFFYSPMIVSGKELIEDLFSDDEMEFYGEMTRFKDISNSGIIAKLNISPDIYWELITILFLSGILDFIKSNKNEKVDEDIVDLIQMRKKLEIEGLNFFDVLMINREDSMGSIHAKYMDLAQKYNPERFGSALAPEIKQSAKFVSNKIGEAYKNLTKFSNNNIKKKLESNEVFELSELDMMPAVEEKREKKIEEDILLSMEPEDILPDVQEGDTDDIEYPEAEIIDEDENGEEEIVLTEPEEAEPEEKIGHSEYKKFMEAPESGTEEELVKEKEEIVLSESEEVEPEEKIGHSEYKEFMEAPESGTEEELVKEKEEIVLSEPEEVEPEEKIGHSEFKEFMEVPEPGAEEEPVEENEEIVLSEPEEILPDEKIIEENKEEFPEPEIIMDFEEGIDKEEEIVITMEEEEILSDEKIIDADKEEFPVPEIEMDIGDEIEKDEEIVLSPEEEEILPEENNIDANKEEFPEPEIIMEIDKEEEDIPSKEPEEFIIDEKVFTIENNETPEPEIIEEVEKKLPEKEEEPADKEILPEKVPVKKEIERDTGGKNLNNEARLKYLEANDFYQKKMYDEAVPLLKQSVKLEPNKYEYFYLLGVCQTFITYFYTEAERNLKKAIELNPTSPDPVFSLGELYAKEKKKNLAKKCFQRTLSINPGYVKALRELQTLNRPPKSKKRGLFKK